MSILFFPFPVKELTVVPYDPGNETDIVRYITYDSESGYFLSFTAERDPNIPYQYEYKVIETSLFFTKVLCIELWQKEYNPNLPFDVPVTLPPPYSLFQRFPTCPFELDLTPYTQK